MTLPDPDDLPDAVYDAYDRALAAGDDFLAEAVAAEACEPCPWCGAVGREAHQHDEFIDGTREDA